MERPLTKDERKKLHNHIKYYVTWFDECHPLSDFPEDVLLDQMRNMLSVDVRQLISLKKYRLLFKLRLEHYRQTKKE